MMVAHDHFDDKSHGKNGRKCARMPILLSLAAKNLMRYPSDPIVRGRYLRKNIKS